MDHKERLAQIMALQGALSAAWPVLRPLLEQRRQKHIEELVRYESQMARGRIRELNELLELPESLQQEAQALVAPQQEGELP